MQSQVRALASPSNKGRVQIPALTLLVLSFALRGFSLGSLVFPSTQEPTFPKLFQFNQESGRQRATLWTATSKSLSIYLIE